MTLAVLIPTWKRPQMLHRCLEHLGALNDFPNMVYIVTRQDDQESIDVIKRFESKLPISHVIVKEEGVIHAENAGLKEIKEDIVCFLDDDAYVPKDWISRIKRHFENEEITGVGGPDLIIRQIKDNYRRNVNTVGKLTWYGNPIGNHHHKVSKIHEVDILKGVNMSFRKKSIAYLDTNLQSAITDGNGSFWELDLCMSLRGKGKLIFDPSLEVEHDSDHSHFIEDKVIYNNSRNYVYVMMKNYSFIQKTFFITYITLIGNSNTWGLLKLLQQVFKGHQAPIKHYIISIKGFLKGLRVARQTKVQPRYICP